MPNWCYTSYIIEGKKEEIKSLYKIMKELQEMKDPGLCKNDFGSSWMGNLVAKLGGDWEKVYCRGDWEDMDLQSDGSLRFSVESAWNELSEVRGLIQEKFPGLEIYYFSEEDDMGIFETNDREGRHYDFKYKLWVETEGGTDYINSLDRLIQEIKRITGFVDLKTFEDCQKALDLSFEDTEISYSLDQINII